MNTGLTLSSLKSWEVVKIFEEGNYTLISGNVGCGWETVCEEVDEDEVKV